MTTAPTRATPGDEPARPLSRTWWPWIPLFLVVVLTLAIGALGSTGPATNADRVVEIAKVVKCPICNGETVAESNADIARAVRLDIAERVDQGQTDEQIQTFLVQRYGDRILLTPTSSGVTGFVWITPVVVLLLSLAALGFAFRRWGERTPTAATAADRELVRAALVAEHAPVDASAMPVAETETGPDATPDSGPDEA